MKITALVENKSNCELKPKHGLALYIETAKHKILFDVGSDDTLFSNCEKRGIDLAEVDIVIISHGHFDHGGALAQFLKINQTAKVYIQRKAFEKHYAKILFLKKDIGIAANLKVHPQMVLLEGDYIINDELKLFTVPNIDKCYSTANKILLTDTGRDDFSHEQNLIIMGNENVLIMGCGHAGVVNILERAAEYKPQVCVGGYHLYNPANGKTVSDSLLGSIAGELMKYDIKYYTCHCTGQKAYDYFAECIPKMNYLSCGDTITINSMGN
jgi:7,8-dihydropterin-6-yl-methyl-4-(beta-D-ribofuranosyl)aminobenzene 5'-phosphate synthase